MRIRVELLQDGAFVRAWEGGLYDERGSYFCVKQPAVSSFGPIERRYELEIRVVRLEPIPRAEAKGSP